MSSSYSVGQLLWVQQDKLHQLQTLDCLLRNPILILSPGTLDIIHGRAPGEPGEGYLIWSPQIGPEWVTPVWLDRWYTS